MHVLWDLIYTFNKTLKALSKSSVKTSLPKKKSNVKTNSTLQSHNLAIQNQAPSKKNLEIQISRITNIFSIKVQGALPSNTVTNLKESIQAIYLRNVF